MKGKLGTMKIVGMIIALLGLVLLMFSNQNLIYFVMSVLLLVLGGFTTAKG